MDSPYLGISLMLEPGFRAASLPLFEKGIVEVIEWSYDMIPLEMREPDWAKELLDFYSSENKLLCHGVSYSILSAQPPEHRNSLLSRLKNELASRNYLHLTEHFGFMTAGDFHRGAPLPVPRNKATLEIGRSALLEIKAQTNIPIGLENLAFAFSEIDVKDQGDFISELLEAVDGFILLDLHNLYCQMHNFSCSFKDLLQAYPLEKVREIHVSGGSWSESSSGKKIRRDTHDYAIPEEVFNMLPIALKKCPNVIAVIFEQLGTSITSEEAANYYQKDFLRLREILK